MPFEIIRGDITRVKADAIVNAANIGLKRGGGVCGAIFDAAGAQILQKECDTIGECSVGGAVLTKAYNLPADYIIHCVGPVWHGGDENEEALLRSAYKNALQLAKEHGLSSIAFPLISAGIYGYPKGPALKVATQTIQAFLAENDMRVTLVIFDKSAFQIDEDRRRSVFDYIETRYEEHIPLLAKQQIQEFSTDEEMIEFDELHLFINELSTKAKAVRELSDIVPDETFSSMLLRLIDEKGETDTDVYKRANIDRKLFSKIRTNQNYQPKKTTVFAFAVALRLSLDETKDLLRSAGFALSHSYVLDIIIEYFIARGIYDTFEINETLFAFEQPLLGV